jgi:hypothetical protein
MPKGKEETPAQKCPTTEKEGERRVREWLKIDFRRVREKGGRMKRKRESKKKKKKKGKGWLW